MSRPVRPKAKGPKEYDCAAKSRGVDDEEHEARRLARLDEDDVDDLRAQIDVFHYADPKLTLCATVLARALEGHRVGGAHVRPALCAALPPGAPTDMPVPARAQDRAAVGEVLREILRATHLPATDADLQAVGRWPGLP